MDSGKSVVIFNNFGNDFIFLKEKNHRELSR